MDSCTDEGRDHLSKEEVVSSSLDQSAEEKCSRATSKYGLQKSGSRIYNRVRSKAELETPLCKGTSLKTPGAKEAIAKVGPSGLGLPLHQLRGSL